MVARQDTKALVTDTCADTCADPALKSKRCDGAEFTLDNTPISLEDWEDWLESD